MELNCLNLKQYFLLDVYHFSSMKLRTVFISLCLMLLALFIYVFYRPEETVACQIWASLPFANFIDLKSLRNQLPLNSFLIYSFPAGLWVCSTTMLSFKQQIRIFNQKISLIYLPLLYGTGLEFMQAFHLTDGTYDNFDLLAMGIAWLAAMIYLSFHRKTPKEGQSISRLVLGAYAILILADTLP